MASSDLNLTERECRARAEAVTPSTYEVRLDLGAATDPTQETFTSETTLRFTATTDTTWIDIVADRIEAASLNGAPLDVAAYDGARLRLAGLASDNELVVRAQCRYSRTGEGLHRFVDPEDEATYLYTHFEPTDSRRVFAVFEQPDLKASFTFQVTADASWTIRSGQPEVGRDEQGGVATVRFAPSPPQSSYITAVIAGPYHLSTGKWSVDRADGSHQDIPLGVLCRASMARHLEVQDILEVTRAGLSYFDELFAYPYPWGKYDQVFVPEYNIGAMENPGLVTFVDDFVFRGRPTLPERSARAEVILHEMAHMWFGDLATMRWWDGLWLKESFADLMGYQASVEATRYGEGWTSFAIGRKQWAYTQDLRPTTHPISADIPDVQAAAQNFDGITYAKGAAVVRQLQAYVGRAAFDEGVRRYFARHAFGSTQLEDFLAALEGSSDRDLGSWAEAWLRTSGPSELRAARDPAGGLTVHQARLGPYGSPALRPHVLQVGSYDEVDGRLERVALQPLELDGAATGVPAAGVVDIDLVLPNDGDLTYAVSRLDERSVAAALRSLGTMEPVLSRALVWSALWNHTRDAQLHPSLFVSALHTQLASETDQVVLRSVLAMGREAVEHFMTGEERTAAATELARLADARVRSTTGDIQVLWARALAWSGALTSSAAASVEGLLDPAGPVADLDADPDLRWALVTALASVGARTVAALDDDLRADDTMGGRTAYERALASVPDEVTKRRTWDALLSGIDLTNDRQRALIEGFTATYSGDLATPYADAYFAALERVWSEQTQSMAMRWVNGLFPLPATHGGDSNSHTVLAAARTWLTEHPDSPAALRRAVTEGLDDAERTVRVRSMAAPQPS